MRPSVRKRDDGSSFITVIAVLTAYLFATFLAVVLSELDHQVLGDAMQAGAIVVSAGAAIYVGRITYRSSHIPIEDKAKKSLCMVGAGADAVSKKLDFFVGYFNDENWKQNKSDVDKCIFFMTAYREIQDIDISCLDFKYIELLEHEKINSAVNLRAEVLSLKKTASLTYSQVEELIMVKKVGRIDGVQMSLVERGYRLLIKNAELCNVVFNNFKSNTASL